MQETERIWNQYHAMLFRFIHVRVGDETVAEDITQDVFIKIQTGINKLKEKNRLRGWIYRIARNAIIDHYRANKNRSELPDSLATDGAETLGLGADAGQAGKAHREIAACMLPMIERLPDAYRESVLLSEIEGRTQKEVAEIQGLSLSGAKSRIQRGRAMLKDMLLECCSFETDRCGNVIEYETRKGFESGCGEEKSKGKKEC